MDLIKNKINNLKNKYSLKAVNDKDLEIALCTGNYVNQNQEGTNNCQEKIIDEDGNRILALVGDRVIKLTLTERFYKQGYGVKDITDKVNKYESNDKLASIATDNNLLDYSYCIVDGVATENKKTSERTLATLLEAIIGAIAVRESDNKEAERFINKLIK